MKLFFRISLHLPPTRLFLSTTTSTTSQLMISITTKWMRDLQVMISLN